jgi:endonuclease/exonuclease/phosphatase (EEP) superfamily protein YafD
MAMLGAAALLSGAALIWPDLSAGWSEPRPRRAAAPRITLITQNLWQNNAEPGDTAASILAADADVVILQEGRGGGADVVRRVQRAYPYRANCLEKSQWCYMAIFSKRPIRSWTYHVANWQPPQYDRMGLIRATIQGPDGRDFEVIGTHLIHPDPKGDGEQQARQTVSAVADVNRRTAILVGDFNRVPWSFAMRRIDDSLVLRRRTHGLATWPHRLPTPNGGLPLPLPVLPIDQVFAGSDWRVVSVRRAVGAGSDHYGVVATLALEP